MSDAESDFLSLMRELNLNHLEELRVLAEQTGNPVYVWRGLALWFNLRDRHLPETELSAQFPEWIMNSLSIWARRVRDLSEGKDYRIAPQPFGDLPRDQASVQIANRRERTLELSAAMRLVLKALGLDRTGWNAFRQVDRQEAKDLTALTYNLYTEIGKVGDDEAVKMLTDDHEQSEQRPGSKQGRPADPRSIRRQIASSRKARRPKPT